ncbi:MAG: KdsC family phosphatase [bacterium]
MHNPLDDISEKVIAAARDIRLLLLDVDGVMTDGRLHYSSAGDEIKSFNIKDGLGIKLLQRAGIEVGIITGRVSPMVERRATELGIALIVQGREDKLIALRELTQERDIPLNAVAYMGDDLPDLSAIRAVGLGATVADGNSFVAQHALLQTAACGGCGAVRELAEIILSAQNKLADATAPYLQS